MNRSATGIEAHTVLGLLALLPMLKGSFSKVVGWLRDVGRGDPLAFPLPSLVAGTWYVDTDQPEVVAAAVVQDLVVWVSGGCSSEIQYVLSVGTFSVLQVKIRPF